MRVYLIAFMAACAAYGQTRVDLKTQSKSIDFSSVGPTKPAQAGAMLPTACAVGELFFKTNAAGGKNLYTCAQTNQWSQVAGVGSGCGLVGCELGQCSIDSSMVPSYSGTLSVGYILVGNGGSALKTLLPGQPGQVLTSNGTAGDPRWSDLPVSTGGGAVSHSELTHLDFASSGHTGFQPVLGFVPLDPARNLSELASADAARASLGLSETATLHVGSTSGTVAAGDHLHAGVYQPAGSYEAPLTFSAPLSRLNNTVSLPVCSAGEVLKTVNGAWACAAAGSSGGILTEYRAYTGAKCQTGVAGAGFNLPAVNYPEASCVSSGTTVFGTLKFLGTAAAAKSVQDSLEMPPDWTGAVDLQYEFRSADATPGTATLTGACAGPGEDMAGIPLSNSNTTTLTPAPNGYRTVAAQNGLAMTGCAAGERYLWKLVIDTGQKSNAIEIIGLKFTIRRAL